jgi:hypothetical protein
VTDSLPLLVTVENSVAVGPAAISRDPNANTAGLRDSCVKIPVPVKSTVIAGALDETVIVANFEPTTVCGADPRWRR